jgi:hypothetical protein
MRVLLSICIAALCAASIVGVASADYDDSSFQAALEASLAVDPTASTHVSNDSGRDIAVGGGQTTLGYRFSIAASSDPLGGDPRGHVRVTDPDGTVTDGQVACLLVLSEAGVGLALIGVDTDAPGTSLLITATDGGTSGPDSIGFQPSTEPAGGLCGDTFVWQQPLASGQIKIRNALTG